MTHSSVKLLVLFLWSVTDLAANQACVQNLPDYGAPNYTLSLPDRVQALVPAYKFHCRGILTELSANISGTDSQIIFQVWRPTPAGTYTIVADLRYQDIRSSRDGDTITVQPLVMIPVNPGDVIGFFIDNSEDQDQIQLQYENESNAAAGTAVYYFEGSDVPLCNFSLCDPSHVVSIVKTAPLIAVQIEQRTEKQLEEAISQLGTLKDCSTYSFSTCSLQSTQTLQSSTAAVPRPTQSHITALHQTGSPPNQIGPPTQSQQITVPRQTGTAPLPSLGPRDNGQDSSSLTKPDLSIETIVILVIGVVLFVILIVLVVILIVCICHKKGMRVHLSSKTEVGSMGGLTVSTNLGTSAVHSQRGLTAVHKNSAVDDHCYTNTETITAALNGNVMDEERGERLCQSTGALGNANVSIQPQRHSTSNCNSHSTRKTHHYSILEAPLDLSPFQSSPLAGKPNGDSLHYYSMPDENGELWSANYDHLEDSPDPEQMPLTNRYDRLSTPPDIEVQHDKETTSTEDLFQIYTYVPTVEQRRLVQLQTNGRYEVADDIHSVEGYDKLKFFRESDLYWAPASTTSGLYTQLYENKYREIPCTQIRILNQLGSGHFGSVNKGVWMYPEGSESVAVKTVKSNGETERLKLLQEAAIMGQFAHINVVRLHGVVTVGDPVLIVLEYMPRGDLRSFLQKLHPKNSKRDLPEVLPRLFIKFGKDIATGMGYLSKKCFVHRDLAARNILLTNDLTCKIGDFGMARDIEGENDYYRSQGGIIPVKWTAPEALNYNKFTSASDVWSYGMVLYEIWSIGQKPFNNLTNPIVVALVNCKHCQPPPPGCPRPIYHLMVECWNPVYTQRPTFDSIHDYMDSPEESLLQWHPNDIIPDKKADVLGAPLLEANNLYFDLQRTYQNTPKRTTHK